MNKISENFEKISGKIWENPEHIEKTYKKFSINYE